MLIGVGAGTGVSAGGRMKTFSGVGAGLAAPPLDIRAGGISGSRVWRKVILREYTTNPVIAPITL